MKKTVIILSVFVIAAISAIVIVNDNNKKEREKKANDIMCTSFDGVVQSSVFVRDTYNEGLLTKHETANMWKVYRGEITKLDSDKDNLDYKTKIQLKNIDNETAAKIILVH